MPPCAFKKAHGARAITWAISFWAIDRPSEPSFQMVMRVRFWSPAPQQHSWWFLERPLAASSARTFFDFGLDPGYFCPLSA
jgi:hypothetical protein